MDKIIINKTSINKIIDLQNISQQTFIETFGDSNSKENMDKYLADSFNLNQLTKELSNINSIFYIAYDQSKTIGYLKINFGASQSEIKNKNAFEIERIYVLKDYFGKSIGQLLFNKALEIAKDRQSEFIWLGVWEKNPRAINFYKKNNFCEFDKHIFKLGDDLQTDIMMKLEL